MKFEDVIGIFKQADAILEGHFVLSSGRHSPTFLQKARVFMYPELTEKLCRGLADKIREAGHEVDLVVSPALGGLIPGFETARHLGVPAIWVEREDGTFQLRRGFRIEPGTRVAIIEDIVTTGLSSREAVECVKALGGDVRCCGCLIDRSNGRPIRAFRWLRWRRWTFPITLRTKFRPNWQRSRKPSRGAGT